MRFFLALWLALAVSSTARATMTCGESPFRNNFKIGLSLQQLMPDNLPDFVVSLPAYGIVVSAPLGASSIQLLSQYGSGDKFYLYSFELNYIHQFTTPFFMPFALAGAHFLHYALSGVGNDAWGGNVGFGLLFPLSSGFEITLALKGYLETRAIIAFGGGFSFLL